MARVGEERDKGARAPGTPGQTPKKHESVFGMSLGRTLGLTGSSISAGASESAPPSARSLSITDSIAKRYSAEVRQSEKSRLERLVPLDQLQTPVRPDERDMARTMKGELDTVLQKVGMDPGSSEDWDKLVTTNGFQKKIEYLVDHARTGQFVEQYGAEGRYDGDFLYGMRHGKGTHEFRDEVYEGEWKWDNRHGSGTLTLKDGSQIKGEWEGGKPHGFVSMIDTKGTIVYEGEFRRGKRDGLGRQLFESGDMYDGGWKEGKLNDRGVYYFTNGDKLYGMWKDGVYHGTGVFHYADGSVSRREYKNGRLQSVQDYEHNSQRFGKSLTRDGMQRHTREEGFPKDVFLLSTV